MKKEIIIFIPYFGKLPVYFQTFLHSCQGVEKIHFYIFTDDAEIGKMVVPSTVSYNLMTFDELAKRISSLNLGELPYSYKLCDYKPLYGLIFSDYAEGYDYWGYCDVDTMMGDVDGFLAKINYKQYDRIGEKGHFTIYRNVERLNYLYKTKLPNIPPIYDFDFVKQTTYPCNFDESGMNWICDKKGVSFYKCNHVAQMTIVHDFHLHTSKRFQQPEIFVWEKGHVYCYYRENGELKKEEYMYIHFEDRKNMPAIEPLSDKVLITHEGFRSFSTERLEDLLDKYGAVETDEERSAYVESERQRIRRGQKTKLYREFKYCGLRAFYNLYGRYKSIKWLKAHNID